MFYVIVCMPYFRPSYFNIDCIARKSSSGTGSKKRRAGGSSSASHSKRKSATQLPGQPPTRTVKDMLATQHRQIDKESSAQRAQKTFMRHFKVRTGFLVFSCVILAIALMMQCTSALLSVVFFSVCFCLYFRGSLIFSFS